MLTNITMTRWFVRQEIDLMKLCLEAWVSGRFIEAVELHPLTGWDLDHFQDLLARFDTVAFGERALSKDDYATICQVIGQSVYYPIDRPHEFEQFVGVPRLHLAWFSASQVLIWREWDQRVQDDAKESRKASNIP